MTYQQPGSYDWGAPAQPAAQPVPQPTAPMPTAPKESKGIPAPMKPILAILGVIALVFAGLWVFQKVRPEPVGPLGWDEATLASKLDGGQLTNCDLGNDFYDSVGIHDVKVGDHNCTGVIHSADGSDISATVYTAQGPNGELQSPKDTELVGWKESADANKYVPESLDALEKDTHGSGARCQMAGNKPMLKSLWLSVNGPCEALYPAARQLDNLQTQYDWERSDHGLFDFSKPEYHEVNATSPSVEAAVYKQAKDEAKQLGDPMAVVDTANEGSTFAVTGGKVSLENENSDALTVCVDAEFKLGREVHSSYSFNMPSTVVALFPNGQRVNLDRKQGHIRMKPGETAQANYCSYFTPEVDANEFVAFVNDEDGEHATWVIDGARSGGGKTQGA